MLFNSIHYLIFLAVVCVVFYLLKGRLKVLWLLVSSYGFYMSWNPWYAIFLVFITLNDFYCARLIQAYRSQKYAILFTIFSISANVSLLIFFKFLDTINHALISLSHGDFFVGNLVIPLGISYHTFQSISYIIDVKRGRIQASHEILDFAWFIVFFPQLIAGPIERASTMFPQVSSLRNPGLATINSGLRMFAWGLFKKAVIADRLALLIDPVFNKPELFPAWLLIFVLFAFTLQIYFDFSGYADMARGSALLFGVVLSQNFNHPLSFISLREFWRNWHISLSSWLPDYIYIPLGGRYRNAYRNLFVTFLLSGIWHGTGWNFLIFGFFHGLMMVLEKKYAMPLNFSITRHPILTLLPRFLIFHTILAVGWLLFRNPDLHHAQKYAECLLQQPFAGILPAHIPLEAFAGVFLAVLMVLAEDNFMPKLLSNPHFSFPVRAIFYSGILLLILFFGVFNQREFIYFQF